MPGKKDAYVLLGNVLICSMLSVCIHFSLNWQMYVP